MPPDYVSKMNNPTPTQPIPVRLKQNPGPSLDRNLVSPTPGSEIPVKSTVLRRSERLREKSEQSSVDNTVLRRSERIKNQKGKP